MSRSPGWTGATGTPTRLLLARHGQTPLSVDRRYSGQGDPALTDVGRTQAERTAARLTALTPHAVVSSPLQRCTATAELVAQQLSLAVEIDRDLIETDFGQWEGLTFTEAADRDPELHRSWVGDTTVSPPGGESFDAVRARVARSLQRLGNTYPGRTVALVSHVTPIKLLLQAALSAGDQLLYRLHLDLASLSEIRLYPDGNTSVHLVNDTSHLD